jgi:hypothetical protein
MKRPRSLLRGFFTGGRKADSLLYGRVYDPPCRAGILIMRGQR